MATLATAMVRLNTTQQAMSNQDLLGARASQAARAGVEWGLFQLRGGTCNTTTLTDFRDATGFTVTVACSFNEYSEGEDELGAAVRKRFYSIDATACNIGATCPGNAHVGNADYVERRRIASACLTAPPANAECY